MYELKVVRDYRDGKVSKEDLDKLSTCDLSGTANNGLSDKSKKIFDKMSGEDFVKQDLLNQYQDK